jgi:chemotaxis receptor (MCP) glutamine deamidase CheD
MRVVERRHDAGAYTHSSRREACNGLFFRYIGCPMPTTILREVLVAPDRFEVVSDDAVLVADLRSATAVCIYDAVEEAGALLHLRFIIRSQKPADVTDTTLATELLLLDRCIESLREAMPNARAMQAKIAAHLPDNPDAQRACDSVLTLVRHFLSDSGMSVVSSDVAAGPARELRFRPAMGWLQLK